MLYIYRALSVSSADIRTNAGCGLHVQQACVLKPTILPKFWSFTRREEDNSKTLSLMSDIRSQVVVFLQCQHHSPGWQSYQLFRAVSRDLRQEEASQGNLLAILTGQRLRPQLPDGPTR